MRRYLIAIAVVVLGVFLAAGAIVGRQVLQGAERNVRLEAANSASVVARLLGSNVATAVDRLAPLAAHPDHGARLAGRGGACLLPHTPALFAGSRLDLVRPDGSIDCSSIDLPVGGASHAGAAWVVGLDGVDSVLQSDPVRDPLSGQLVIIAAQPVRGPAGEHLGAVAVVLPTAGVAGRLAEVIGSPRGYEVALADGRSGRLLATSADLEGVALGQAGQGVDPLRAAGYFSEVEAVPGTAWHVAVGITPGAALERAYSVLLRGGLVAALGYTSLLVSLAVVYRRIARPLRQLSAVADDTGPQAGEALELVRGPAEVVRLADSFREALTTRKAFEDQLVQQALHDPLTGLPNRALLAERLAHSLQQASRSRTAVAVLFLDLDGFKLVNESLGHAVGDEVLIVVARRLRDILRPGDTLARFGGDEFVVVAEGIEGREQAERLAERLLAVVQTPVPSDDAPVRISASIGIAVSDRTSEPADLISDADNALYLAKERGRSRHEVFDLSLRDRVTTRLTVANALRDVLDEGGMHLVYQPQIDLRSGLTVGVEALLRWDHPGLGSVSPATFIPIAEDTGSILPIGRFVLEEACRQAARWHAEGLDLVVSVNLSGRQLVEPHLVDHVASVLDLTGVGPARLCLELTESVLMSDTPRAAEALRDLRDLGVKISIDDFGTGYSSLAYLHRFPVDHLKIDRAFVKDMTERDDQRSLVGAMVAMGSALGMAVVAEGVESPEQAEQLRHLGCHAAQGYHFARPQPARALQPLLHRSARQVASTGRG